MLKPDAAHTTDFGDRADRPQGSSGRCLRTLGIVAPALAVACLGVGDLLLEGQPRWESGTFVAWRIVILLAVTAATVVFALLMFGLIDRSERRVLLQNRDLGVAQAVASAIQGLSSRAAVADAAESALSRDAGAARVRIVLSDAATGEVPADATEPDAPARAQELVCDGRLQGEVRLWYPPDTPTDEQIGSRALATIGTQLAYALRLGQAHDDLRRGRDEGHAFYDILLQISHQTGTIPTLRSIATEVQRLLDADAAAIVISQATANSVRFDSTDADGVEGCADGTYVIAVGLPEHRDPDTGRRVNPIGCQHWASEASLPIQGSSGSLGTVWAGRRTDREFSGRDYAFLSTMSGLADVALTSADLVEQSRLTAVLAERTRIARETHDSHAQVLGAVHLRLRGLEANPVVQGSPAVAAEVAALAEICADAYADVRELITALRDSEKQDRSLDSILRAYVEKYSAHYGIETTYVNRVGEGLALSPRAETELVRVVQEALTNVRKHACASRATVTVEATDAATMFTVSDDGVGFSSPSSGPAEGYGMVTMRERLAAVSGTLAVMSAPRRGTTLVATVPEAPMAGAAHRRT